ncbi:MAG TPA: CBS domain-containing protein, partial [Polyangiales bacterium]|nr:CBS domain-containing protein [Polyangiales bacterium]
IALGSGTSGGTLAPLLTFGAGMGWLLSDAATHFFPHAGIDPRVGALVGMTAMFAGASRALLASITFALESTQEIHAVVPIVAGVSLAYFASCLMMRTTIMTEKLVRRGVRVAAEYEVSPLAHVTVGSLASTNIRSLEADARVGDAIQSLARHQASPVVREGRLIGVVTSRELLAADPSVEVESLITRPPVTASANELGRVAVERMANEGVGRLVIVDDDDPHRVIGMLTRSDLITAFARHEAAPEHG